MFKKYVGWDIGGAHLKVATIDRCGSVDFVIQLPTPLWQDMDTLNHAIADVHNQIATESVKHAITMTAELCDIFSDRKTGVQTLMELIREHFQQHIYFVYVADHGLLKANEATTYTLDIASANWHATANFVSRHIANTVLIDIGSTTTDMIPIIAGKLTNLGNTDQQRLCQNELVYTGIIRTPVMSVVDKLFFNGRWQNIIAENFATMADIYRLTAEITQQDDMLSTADGEGKTPHDSARRLARMIGLDWSVTSDIQSMIDIAKYIANQQLKKIEAALLQILSRPRSNNIDCLIGAGCGCFLVRKLAVRLNLQYIDFTDIIDCKKETKHNVLTSATAVSVAQIARVTN